MNRRVKVFAQPGTYTRRKAAPHRECIEMQIFANLSYLYHGVIKPLPAPEYLRISCKTQRALAL
jgi:hypothetical protein